MKIRDGFVSNSSSSSYLILGWHIQPNAELLRKVAEAFELDIDGLGDEEIEEQACELIEEADLWHSDECDLLGIRLGGGYDYESFSIPIGKLDEKLQEAKDLAKKLDLLEPMLIGGTEY